MSVKSSWCAAALLLASLCPAQRIWEVRATGGDFRTLPEAMAAASPGDTIMVHVAVMNAVIDKGVSVYFRALVSWGVYIVRNIPAGQTALISEARGQPATLGGEPQFSLLIHDCAGSVRLTGCVQTPNGGLIESPTFVHVIRCDDVTFDGCFLANLRLRDSTLRMHATTVFGDVFPRFGGQDSSAIDAENSEIIINRDGVSGAPGGTRPVVNMVDCRLRVDRASIGSNPCQIPIVAERGSIELGRQSLVRNRCGGATIVGTATVHDRDWPMLLIGAADGEFPYAGRESNVHMLFRVEDDPGTPTWLFVGPSGRKTVIPGIDDLWIDPANIFLVGSGTIPATGQLEWRFRMGYPACPANFAYTFQAVSVRAGVPYMSLPAQIVQLLIF